jgi:hypothetical protein
MACPPQLGQSPFAIACTALNVQACTTCFPMARVITDIYLSVR